jgi:hypothetical protein
MFGTRLYAAEFYTTVGDVARATAPSPLVSVEGFSDDRKTNRLT